MNSRTGPDDQGWDSLAPEEARSCLQLALPQAPPSSRKMSEVASHAGCSLQTQGVINLPRDSAHPPPETNPRPLSLCSQAPRVAAPWRLGSYILSLLSKSSLRCTCLFNSCTHSFKANKSDCFLKPRHAYHRAGPMVETVHIY